MKIRAIVIVLAASVLLLPSAFPQEPVPNLSGTWKANAAKSSWGPGRKAMSIEWRIKQEGNKIALEIIHEGESPNKLEMVVDGKSRVIGVDAHSKTEILTRASWEGRDLVMDSAYSDPKLPRINSRLSLSANGKVLKDKRSDNITIVFDKQEQIIR